jgi:nucleotide-binding universal stress UspA family protein
MFTHILLPIDGSELSLQAARHGIELAWALNARVTAIMVTTPWATHSPASRRWWCRRWSCPRTNMIAGRKPSHGTS